MPASGSACYGADDPFSPCPGCPECKPDLAPVIPLKPEHAAPASPARGRPARWGLKVRRTWLGLVSRAGASAAVARLAAFYAMHADSAGLVYAGSKTLADEIGIGERKVKEHRKVLVDAGWLVDTGQRRNRAVVYRLDLGGPL